MDRKIQVYAVLRWDDYRTEKIEDSVTVKEILPTWEEAVAEVSRLNGLNKEKGCRYFCQTTRYFPEGRKDDIAPPSGLNVT